MIGQDGISYAPVRTKEQLDAVRSQITAWNGNPTDEECAAGGKLDGVGMFGWRTVREYLDTFDKNGVATNVAFLVPQGNLRLLACGPYDTVATPEQLEDQVKLLREGLADGAVGMSSGLTYTPGMYASTSELGVLCAALAEHKGTFYAPHHRSYGNKALESYLEMLDLGRRTGCGVHLTHATMNFAENKGRAPELIKLIDEAIKDDVDLSLDTYPYLPGCTTLSSLLPSWASAGGPAETLECLKDPAQREKIRIAVEVTGCDGGHGLPTKWEDMEIGSTHHPSLASYSGRRVSEVAVERGEPPIETFYHILITDDLATGLILHIGNEENVRLIMQHATHMAGSDGILHGKSLHPRAYGTFPRFLGHYARDEQLMSIPDMVAHMTSRPAKRLGVYPHRGKIAVGSAADLVLFNPETIKARSSHAHPRVPSEGVRFVLVNGAVALDEGKMTGARAGFTLRRNKDGRVTNKGQ